MNVREVELRRQVFSARDDPSMRAVRALAAAHLEQVKSALLRAAPAEVPALQGEGYAMSVLLKWLDEPLRDLKTTVDNQ